jgi:type II secretory pathway pseudopilin PulG
MEPMPMTLPPGPPAESTFGTPLAFPAGATTAPPPASFPRPGVVTFLAVLDIAVGLLYLGVGTLLAVLGAAGQIDEAIGLVVFFGGFIILIGAFYLATGLGLWILRPFGRTCQFVLSVFWLLSIPIGTLIGAMTMYYLTRPGVALLFAGRPPATLSPDQRASVDRDARGGALLVVLIVCVGLGAIAVVGILAAIAIPGLLSARISGNEAAAIGRMRSMVSAQMVYASQHNGQFATLGCLNDPARCPPVAGEPPAAPYLPADLSASPDHGYSYRLSLSDDQTHFTYWAEPERAGTSGRRAFCVDPSGSIAQYEETIPAPPNPGEPCPAGGEPLM